MLTDDDLDHFADPTAAHLFTTPSAVDRANTLQRRQRILACLRFCRDIPDGQLPEDGLRMARRILRSIIRSQQRDARSLAPEDLQSAVQAALWGLGEPARSQDEPPTATPLRHAVEREIEQAARALTSSRTVAPELLAAVARGDFELGPRADLAALEDTGRRLGGVARIALELGIDTDAALQRVRFALSVEPGLWRWSAHPACTFAVDDGAARELPADDDLVSALVAGISLRNGRSILAWARALREG